MTTQKKESILPSYCYPAGQWFGKAAEQPWTRTDSAILIGSLVALCGFITFIVLFTASF